MDSEKQSIKNGVCVICGKRFAENEKMEVSKTQRNTIILFHKKCYEKGMIKNN